MRSELEEIVSNDFCCSRHAVVAKIEFVSQFGGTLPRAAK